MTILPQEIQDKIFLELDYKTLEISRELQSEYIKHLTEYNSIEKAVDNGNLENTRWLKEQGCPWSSKVFELAALNGNLENMKWLREEGCPWDQRTFVNAAVNGNIENMKWLREQECPWGSSIFEQLSLEGKLEKLKHYSHIWSN